MQQIWKNWLRHFSLAETEKSLFSVWTSSSSAAFFYLFIYFFVFDSTIWPETLLKNDFPASSGILQSAE